MKPRAIVFHIVSIRGVIAATHAIPPDRGKRGFALIATMLMMILILVVAVGLLSLSTISVRSTNNENIRRMAKSNARLALSLALADIQKHLGDDRRVTADGAMLDPAIKRPGLVGVWESAANTLPENPLGGPPTYNDKKFISWLVSTTKPEDAAVRETAASLPSGETIALFKEVTSGNGVTGGSELAANVLTLKNSKNPGGLAWAVSQAATKASINTGIELAHKDANEQLGAPDRPNLSLSDIATQPEDGWKERRSKVVSLDQALLDSGYAIPPDKKAALALEHTSQSLGVAADVAKGGLKTDLSLGFEMSDDDFRAPSWGGMDNPFHESGMPGNEKRLYQSIGSPGTVTLNSDYGVVKYTMSMDTGTPPTFASLRSYYSLYKHLYRRGTPTARQRFQASPSYNNPSTNAPRGSETSLNPVLDRVLMYYSLTSHGTARDNNLALLITPVVTLWNPYNVAIESDGYVVYPYMDMPIRFWISNKGVGLINGDHMSRFMGRGAENPNEGRQAEAYFYCKITEGGSAGTATPVRLEPGEVRLFAPTTARVALDRAGANENENQTTGRTLRMKPLGTGGTDAIPTNGGLIVRLNERSGGGGITHSVQPTDQFQVTFDFQTGSYNYFLSLEDATRIKNPATPALANIPRITETQVLGSQTPSISISSPTIAGSLVRGTSSKVFAVVETYHRTAGQRDTTIQPADIVYTVNPRQRHTNYMVSGASDMQNAHYSSALRSVSDIGSDVSNFGGRSFYGIANSPPAGRDLLSFFEVPQAPMMSLGAFQNADLSNSAFSPSSQFGNSWASPYIESSKVAKVLDNASSVNTNRLEPNGLGLFDHSYLLNSALWDSCFFSSLAPESSLGSSGSSNAYDRDLSQVSKGLDKVVSDWIEDPIANPLRNRRHILHTGGVNAEDLEKKLLAPEGCREAAAHILVEGSFNVNSVNEKAWRAMFASLKGQKFQINGGTKSHDAGQKTPVSRMTNPSGEPEDAWNGFRELSDGQIRDLAKEMVAQVRERGPFQSMGEFVNRRLSGGENGHKGALQAAIDKAQINGGVDTGTFDTAGYPYPNNIPDNNTGIGTPGWLTQADVLNALGPFMSVRSDTFTVRVYGDARDASGTILSRCYLEAQVQRVPEWVDSSNQAADPIASLSPVNKTFGRKFEVVSVREVSPQEL